MLSTIARGGAGRVACLSCAASGVSWSRSFQKGASRVVELQSYDEYLQALDELTATNRAAVYNFTAKWCGPCKMIAPLFDKLSQELESVRFYKIDIDNVALQPVVEAHGVVGIPNFSFYRGGERVGAFRGAKKDQLLGRLQQLSAQDAAVAGVEAHAGSEVPFLQIGAVAP